jgi:hypothetical protein
MIGDRADEVDVYRLDRKIEGNRSQGHLIALSLIRQRVSNLKSDYYSVFELLSPARALIVI